ncbi:MAG: PKD domain-containing protein [Oscillibacter sp.]|nr:PKD domain-containing protein [Oscillibacter sp.]
MKKIVRVSLIGVLFLLVAGKMYAQSRVTINPGTFRDSITFVNPNYKNSSSTNVYELQLTFKEIGSYVKYQVNWGDGKIDSENTINSGDEEKKTSHKYETEGNFPIQIYFWSDGVEYPDTLYAWAFNTQLMLDYALKPFGDDKNYGCLSYDADTLLLCFGVHDNPPLTKYFIHVETDAPMQNGAQDTTLEVVDPSKIDLSEKKWMHVCWANKEEGRRDSIWLIFTEATGVKGAKIFVKMDCEYWNDQGTEKHLKKDCRYIVSAHIFDKPDLRQIFRDGRSPFPDTLTTDFTVCAPGSPNEFSFAMDWFQKYQTSVLGEDSPGVLDREAFKVECYYTDDSVSSKEIDPEGVKWDTVSGNSEYFNDTTWTFYRAGFYRIRWELKNECNEENPDTLWTSLIRDGETDAYYDDKFRYIQVYENQEASLDYWGDSVFCLNVKDSVIFVDRNRRKFYDAPPVYSLKIEDMDTGDEIEEKTFELKETKIYKGGNILNTEASGINREGCDSTTIMWEPEKPGNYQITWTRKGQNCEEGRTKVFEFHVGGSPELVVKDTLRNYVGNEIRIDGDKLYSCGPYKFNVPDLSDAFDSHNRKIDSVRYKFVKGTKDSVLVYEEYEQNMSFLFDSTGTKVNYILVNVYNGCGISETDSVGFYTPVQPDSLSIWRDSVKVDGTDTLCLNAEYKYYLHGVLPEEYEDHISFTGKGTISINNGVVTAGHYVDSRLRMEGENYGLIKYLYTGTFGEHYEISNKEFSECKENLHLTIEVVDAPDSMRYKDYKEILYCASLDTLDTRVLFEKEENVNFKRATWGWKGGIVKEEKFPKLLFREGKDDTLYVNTIQSTNCYFRDTLIFKPQPVPQANFSNAIENICVPDTLKDVDFNAFVKDGNFSEIAQMRWMVYENAYNEKNTNENLVYSPKMKPDGKLIFNEQSVDSIGLIYFMQNQAGFIRNSIFSDNGCWSLDTLPLKVHKPRLKILKKDTLDDKDSGVYDFTEIQNNYVEAKDLNQDTWTWATAWDGADESVDNTSLTYALGENDKKLDSLLFVLTAHTYCGEPISDTLVVYFPHIVINAHRDTICAGTKDYVLWGEGKTTGLFVKTEDLAWEIIKNASKGSLSASKGTEVKFSLGSDPITREDTIKIKVTGKSIADAGEKSDTILLWVNPAPSYTKLNEGDTLILYNQEINIGNIKALKYQNVSGLKVKKVDGWATVDGDSVIKSSITPSQETVNNKFTADITLKALPGCTDSTIYNVPMMDLVYPYAIPKYSHLDLCAKEEYGVDSLVTFKDDQKDRFTAWKWSIVKGGGSWKKQGDDTVAYKAGTSGGIEAEEIVLSMNKRYIAYDSTKQSLLSSDAKRTIKVNVHAKPTIGFNPSNKDTLCNSASTIELKGGLQGSNAKILVTPDFYKDSLRFNGEKLSNDSYLFRKDEGETDTVYVTVSQGRCDDWADYKEELYLYKRESMPKKLQNVSVCENGSVMITYPEGILKQEYYWKWDTVNGRLDTTGRGLSPIYYPKTTEEGMVELHVEDWPNCEDKEHDFSRITVYKRADLQLPNENQVICKKEGNSLQIPFQIKQLGTPVAEVQKIEWYKGYNKNNVATIVTNGSTQSMSEFKYSLTAEDITHDTMYIVAKAMFKTPCGNEPTDDTVVVILSGQPVITQLQTPVICQGDSLTLLKVSGSKEWLKIENAVSVEWQNSSIGDIQDSLFLSGENSGRAQLTAIAQGLPGCVEDTETIFIEIKKAPKPQFSIVSSLRCQREETELKATIAASQWEWKIEDKTYGTETVTHNFNGVGNVNVSLKQLYIYDDGLTCPREHTEPVMINPAAHAGFEVVADFEYNGIKQIATNEALNVRNTSQPVGGSSAQWNVDRYLSPCNQWELNCNSYIFSDTGRIAIKLKVTTQDGCTDDTIGYVKVVAKPEPHFTVEHNPCNDTVGFELSVEGLNGASVWWDFGKGDGFVKGSGAAEKRTETYFVGYEDTTYHVALKLINAAAPDGVVVEEDIHFVSRLDASLEIVPEKTGCHEIYREIVLDIKGKNDAGYVIWGDKWYSEDPNYVDSLPFKGNNIRLLSHRFENPTLEPVEDTIRLHVGNVCFSKADTQYLTILPPTAGAKIGLINGSSLCFKEDMLQVKNASFGFDKATAEWEWKFESGNSAWVQSNRDTATHRYLSPGVYTVILNMRDRCNSDTAMQEITVKGNDSLYFEIQSHPYCTGENVTLKFIQKGMPEFSDLRWTIYDPRTGHSLKAMADSTQWTYKFRDTGDYEVLLTAKADGCKDGQTLPLHIDETPEAMISLINGSVAEGCEAHTVEFQAADGSSLRKMPHILWDFQNGVKSSQLKEKVVFENEGTYNVALTLTSDSGCVNTVYQEIIVKHTPRISFVTDDSLFCLEQNGAFEVRIENTSEDLDRCRFEWFKKVGAGPEESILVAPQLSPLHFENVSGTIGLRLLATDLTTQCQKDFTKEIVASDAIKAHIFKEAEYVCLDNPVYFASRTENMVKAEWDMGDEGLSADTAFEYTYDRVGDKMITLRVENKDGCYDIDTLRITVYPLPVVDFVWDKNRGVVEGYPDTLDLPEVDNGGVEFKNYSFVTPDDWGTELYYSWNFGDSTAVNTAKNPTHRFENNGLYKVWLKVTTPYGCVDSTSSTVSIDAVKGLYIPTAFAPAMPDEELGEGNSYMGSARFQPKGIGLYSYQIQVYDPWSGTCVWSSTALKNGQPAEYWDGKFNGADAPAGNYIWKVKAIFIDGAVWQNEKGAMEGMVMLIR